MSDLVIELNYRAVALAQEARDRVAEKPVYIAGSVSNFGAWMETEYQVYSSGAKPGRAITEGLRERSFISEEQAQRNLKEQVDLLIDAGVDFLLAEATGNEIQRQWVIDAMDSAGVPYWVGFKCHVKPGEKAVRTGYFSEVMLEAELDDKLPLQAHVLNLFHSTIEDTSAALPLVRARWPGALGCYPEAGRRDYVHAFADPNADNSHSLNQWVETAKAWTEAGVQVIGGCCGMGLEHIRALNGQLPMKAGG